MPRANGCVGPWLALLSLGGALLVGAPVRAECEAAHVVPRGTDRERVFAEGRAHAAASRYAEARAMFDWILERKPDDWEVQLALARVDAWDGCLERAKARFARVIEHYPHDSEARAAFADVLVWNGERGKALAVIEAGLVLEPRAAELWSRRARLALRGGDRTRAISDADRAEQLSPGDAGIREFRDRLYHGELRFGGRVDAYPEAYPNLYTADLQIQQSWHRLNLSAQAQLIERAGGWAREAIVDGLYGIEGSYQTSLGPAFGLRIGFGAPAETVPEVQAKVFFSTPIAGRWSAAVSYSFWKYAAQKTVHILAPAIGYALSNDVELELRLWTSYLAIDPPGGSGGTADTAMAHAVGVRAIWRVLPNVTVAASYTYGPQLDQAAHDAPIIGLDSHVIAIAGDWRLHRSLGFSAGLGFEHRTSDTGVVTPIVSGEIASYLRW
jgi:YaiO family outer membrane protein